MRLKEQRALLMLKYQEKIRSELCMFPSFFEPLLTPHQLQSVNEI